MTAWSELRYEVLSFERDDISSGSYISRQLWYFSISNSLSQHPNGDSYNLFHSTQQFVLSPYSRIAGEDNISFWLFIVLPSLPSYNYVSLYSGFDSLPTSSDCVVVGIEISTQPGEENSALWLRTENSDGKVAWGKRSKRGVIWSINTMIHPHPHPHPHVMLSYAYACISITFYSAYGNIHTLHAKFAVPIQQRKRKEK